RRGRRTRETVVHALGLLARTGVRLRRNGRERSNCDDCNRQASQSRMLRVRALRLRFVLHAPHTGFHAVNPCAANIRARLRLNSCLNRHTSLRADTSGRFAHAHSLRCWEALNAAFALTNVNEVTLRKIGNGAAAAPTHTRSHASQRRARIMNDAQSSTARRRPARHCSGTVKARAYALYGGASRMISRAQGAQPRGVTLVALAGRIAAAAFAGALAA